MRILFAEDDKKLSKMISFLLTKENYLVDCVYNGQDAIDYANLTSYDIAILDWMMPQKLVLMFVNICVLNIKKQLLFY